jgi:hypothetical protein
MRKVLFALIAVLGVAIATPAFSEEGVATSYPSYFPFKFGEWVYFNIGDDVDPDERGEGSKLEKGILIGWEKSPEDTVIVSIAVETEEETPWIISRAITLWIYTKSERIIILNW